MKSVSIFSILLGFPLLLSSCAREEPGIEGGTDQWLSNDTIAVRGIPVYRRDEIPRVKQTLLHVLVGIRHEGDKELQLRWARAEFKGKGIRPNMIWSPFFAHSFPGNHTVKGTVGADRITEAEIAATESTLDFVPLTLHPRDTCATLVSPVNPEDPSLVKIKVRYGDGTQSGPFLITVNRPSQDR